VTSWRSRKKALTRGQRAIKFIETYCRIPEGKLVGQPMKLEKFQKDFILAVLDNKILTKRAILSMARKNGKGLALDTPIPTPQGWTTDGRAAPEGDRVFDEHGVHRAPCSLSRPIHVGLEVLAAHVLGRHEHRRRRAAPLADDARGGARGRLKRPSGRRRG
jgi:hypothetical protein